MQRLVPLQMSSLSKIKTFGPGGCASIRTAFMNVSSRVREYGYEDKELVGWKKRGRFESC